MRPTPSPRAGTLAVVGLLLGLAAPGCRQETQGYERYIPQPAAARAGVVMALDGWLAGQAPEATNGTSPETHVVDKQRPADRRLKRYEVLGEVPAVNARGFAVRVTLEGDDEPQVVNYIIVGVDPMWVFRQEDYEMLSHWMHEMPEPADRAGEAETKP